MPPHQNLFTAITHAQSGRKCSSRLVEITYAPLDPTQSINSHSSPNDHKPSQTSNKMRKYFLPTFGYDWNKDWFFAGKDEVSWIAEVLRCCSVIMADWQGKLTPNGQPSIQNVIILQT